jgi:hypothetical protein
MATKSTVRDVSIEFSAVRRRFLGLVALEFVLFAVIALLWVWLLVPRVSVWWLIVSMATMHLLFSRIADRRIVCPACSTSLIDIDGFSIFAKACEHCGARFR